MDPIVICCPFQRLSGIDRFIHLFLLLAVEVCNSLSIFAIDSITLALLFCLLFMGEFGGLDEVMLRMFNGAEHALILLENCQCESCNKAKMVAYYRYLWIFVVGAHIAYPLARTSAFTYNSVAISMYSHPTLLA